jgi:hypothetical protein
MPSGLICAGDESTASNQHHPATGGSLSGHYLRQKRRFQAGEGEGIAKGRVGGDSPTTAKLASIDLDRLHAERLG